MEVMYTRLKEMWKKIKIADIQYSIVSLYVHNSGTSGLRV